MNSLRRNKRPLYWSKRDNEVDYEKYLEPVEVSYNYKEISANNVFLTTGAANSGAYIIIQDTNKALEQLSIGDRIYLEMPTEFNQSASDADYFVSSKTEGVNFGEVILKAMVR